METLKFRITREDVRKSIRSIRECNKNWSCKCVISQAIRRVVPCKYNVTGLTYLRIEDESGSKRAWLAGNLYKVRDYVDSVVRPLLTLDKRVNLSVDSVYKHLRDNNWLEHEITLDNY